MKTVLSEAIARLRPTPQEEKEKRKKIDGFMKRLSVPGADVVLGGSAKKETWLRDAYDADIFVRFDVRKMGGEKKDISDILEKSLKKIGNVSRIHGSRDYFQVIEDGFVFEIIPILKIRKPEEAENITDISPLHAEWVKKNLSDPDEVRLAKAFARAAGVYGAESFIRGFSGYCIEILVIHYKGFKGFMEHAAKWKKREVLDIMGYHKNIDIEVNKSKLESPLILIDPVQKGRNVAAALSEENYQMMKQKAKAFLKSPSLDFFFAKEETVETVKKRLARKNTIILKAVPLAGKEDIIGCRLLKVFKHIGSKLDSAGFTITDSGWHWDRKGTALFWYAVKEKELPETMEWPGPPVGMKDHARDFRKKYTHVFVRDDNLFAEIRRKYTLPKQPVSDAIVDGYVKEKTEKIWIEC